MNSCNFIDNYICYSELCHCCRSKSRFDQINTWLIPFIRLLTIFKSNISSSIQFCHHSMNHFLWLIKHFSLYQSINAFKIFEIFIPIMNSPFKLSLQHFKIFHKLRLIKQIKWIFILFLIPIKYNSRQICFSWPKQLSFINFPYDRIKSFLYSWNINIQF